MQEEEHHGEDLKIVKKTKDENYQSILEQIMALVDPALKPVSNQANIVAALREQFEWWWVGFYFVDKDELYLGPFQGPVACTKIRFGKGVCGTSWKLK
jgi:L-methionine (R)-S-oxide reductase